ncbi:MAG: radical SAM protein [Myxococcota bacterium]|jgi:DNA repair photolyase|nr:radical SAM protein [Myxococcota bacterium]
MSRARVFPREVARILTPTGGYLRGFTHSLQPYVGCEFACAYCYVRELSVQRANPYGLPWSEWLAPKTNAAERLRREVGRMEIAGARIFCSSATDPYTPAERRFAITRGCLEVLVQHPPALLVVQTRSPLVARDADLLAQIPSVRVSMSITTDDERVRRLLEPNAPGLALRIGALAKLRAAGVATQAAVAPLLPCDPARLARLLEPVADRVVIDDFFRGDGAGGRRSSKAIGILRAAGFDAWTEPGYADEALAIFRRVFGAERVGVSAEGFATPSGGSAPVTRSGGE